MSSLTTMIFLFFLLLGCATADTGDDFSNNLFTDLSPLLALFGERVTMQFLSQAMGLSDCIILATAPLGIITIIVAAIRVGGPSWLKALIGRATENIAAAELELMSSTSKEVCELWNGRDVVRCAGSAPVWEFICLLPGKEVPKNPTIKVMSLREAQSEGYVCVERTFETSDGAWSKIRAFLPFLSTGNQEGNAEQGKTETIIAGANEVIIIKNTEQAAPNISHNRYKNTGRGELYLAAIFGTFLQIGVLLYCTIITHYSKITSEFQKDGHQVGKYAFPLTFIGTVVLSIGMLICSHVVECSTKEERFQPAKYLRARLVWLQQKKTVGDQEFKSFALFTGEDQPNIITSSRVGRIEQADERQRQESKIIQNIKARGHSELDVLSIKTVVGTITSLTGFFAQFIGIRGMHWSVSVASLIAVLLMAAVRAWVRRGLTKPMLSISLLPGFELDWFVDNLRSIGDAPWCKDLGADNEGKNVNLAEGNASSQENEPKASATQSSMTKESDIGEAQVCTMWRQNLAKLADWRGPVSKEAIAVTLAMETTMNFLDSNLKLKEFSWGYNIRASLANEQELRFNMMKQDGKWKANAGEIEAALSLRLFYAKTQRETQSSTNKSGDLPDDTWLSIKGDVPEMGIRILSPHVMPLLQQLEWWVPADGPQIWKGEAEYITAQGNQAIGSGKSQNDNSGNTVADHINFEVGESRVVGFDPRRPSTIATSPHLPFSYHYGRISQSGKWKFRISEKENDLQNIVIKSEDSLEVLYAKDMISSFIWAVAESLEQPIGGKTDVESSDSLLDTQISWSRLTLHNEEISKLALAIQSTGLCNTHDAYISIVSSLSMQRKLPEVAAVVDLVQNHTKFFEARHLWLDAGRIYMQLSFHLDAFTVESYTYIRAVAMLVSFRNSLRGMLKWGRVFLDKFQTNDYISFETELEKSLGTLDPELRHNVESLCVFQDADGLEHYCNSTSSEVRSKYKITLFNAVEVLERVSRSMSVKGAVKVKDVFDRTPLHYFCLTKSTKPLLASTRGLIYDGAEVNACDIRGWTPLHYACRIGNDSMAHLLLENGASVDVQSRDGTAPIHCAAEGGKVETVEALLDFGANINITDGFGTTALHKAALNGYPKVVDALCKHGCQKTLDEHERGAIHLAAIAGQYSVIDQLESDVNSKDKQGKTPLHLAIDFEHDEFVKHLLKVPHIDINAEDDFGQSPLHSAGGKVKSIRFLLNAGAAKDAQDDMGKTPLHWAAYRCHQEDIKTLVEDGANVEVEDARGRTPLLLATYSTADAQQVNETIRLLIKLGANVNAVENEGETLLHLTARKKTLAGLIPEIINDDIIEKIDMDRSTALHQAAQWKCTEGIKLLIEHGADTECKNIWGHTPQMSAERADLTDWWRENVLVSN